MEKYMSVDEFLEKYFTAFEHDPYAWGNRFFRYVASKAPAAFFEWYEKHKHQIKTQELQELYEEIAKAQKAETSDAKNFLYTVQVLTAADDLDFTDSRKFTEFSKIILNAIQRGVIKKPENSYELLRKIDREYDHKYAVVARELALHPLATPDDVERWLNLYVISYDGINYQHKPSGTDVPPFIGSVDDAKKKLNDLVAITKDKLNQELSKPMPNMDTIKSFEAGIIPRIARQIVAIVRFMIDTRQGDQTADDVEKAKSVADELAREFDMNKILDVEHGNYVQQYADQAEIQIAEMRPAFEKMQQELETLRPAHIKMVKSWDEERQKVGTLEDDKEKLLRENDNLMSTIDFLKGKIKLFLKIFGERADKRELPIQKAKGLQEIVDDNLRKTVDIEQIERDLKTAKERQTKIMKNSPVRI